MLKPEVIVVGAGPAGSATAIGLARQGVRVLVLERAEFPRAKPCGDGLTPRAVALLSDLGIQVPLDPSIVQIVARSPNEPCTSALLALDGGPGTVVKRKELDERIAQRASSLGATIRFGTTVRALALDGDKVVGVHARSRAGGVETFLAPVTILAEGSVGAVARSAPVRRPRGSQRFFAVQRYFGGVQFSGPSSFEFYLPVEHLGAPMAGYGWVFPMQEQKANVGIGCFSEVLSDSVLRHLQVAFERRLRDFDPRFAHAEALSAPVGGPINIGGSGATSTAPGLLLVGDSAGLPSPFSAEGISYALASGALAARAASDFLGGDAPLHAYGQLLSERDPTYDRIAPSLPAFYRNARHLARDIVPMFQSGAAVGRAVLATVNGHPQPSGIVPVARDDDVQREANLASDRAQRLAGRDRPFFGELFAQLGRLSSAPPRLAPFVLRARASVGKAYASTEEVRPVAVCFELLRIASFVLDDMALAGEEETPDGSRGGKWLAATLGLTLADRLLARGFALTSNLSLPVRSIVADAYVGVFRTLAQDSLVCPNRSSPDRAALLAAAAARAGALLGGADEGLAGRIALAAAHAVESGAAADVDECFADAIRDVALSSRSTPALIESKSA